jgi:hypothetical protein
MGHIPEMVKKALYYNVYSAVSGTFFKVYSFYVKRKSGK